MTRSIEAIEADIRKLNSELEEARIKLSGPETEDQFKALKDRYFKIEEKDGYVQLFHVLDAGYMKEQPGYFAVTYDWLGFEVGSTTRQVGLFSEDRLSWICEADDFLHDKVETTKQEFDFYCSAVEVAVSSFSTAIGKPQ